MLLFKIAAVIGEGEPGLERHRLGRNVVAPAQLGGIDAELVGGEIDEALDHVGRLGAAVAAVGSHRIGVGEHGGHIGVDRRRAIDAGERADIACKSRHSGLQVGTDAGNGFHPKGEKIARTVERQLGLGDVVARLCVAEKRFRAGRSPSHRPPDTLRCQENERNLVIDRRLHSKAAADVAGDHADPALRDLENRGKLRSKRMRALKGRVDGIAVLAPIVVAETAARLHAGSGHAIDDEAMLDHMVGLGDCGLSRGLVAEQLNESDIVGAVIPDPRRAAPDRVCSRYAGGQRLIIDRDQLGRIQRLVIGFRHHEGDVVADEAHAILH
jgi:hypothetical protein